MISIDLDDISASKYLTLIEIQVSTTFVHVVSCQKMATLVRGTGEYRKTGRVKRQKVKLMLLLQCRRTEANPEKLGFKK